MADFQFLRPLWLLASIPLGLLLIWRMRAGISSDPWKGIVDERLLHHLRPVTPGQRDIGIIGGVAVAGLLAILALAGPVWDKVPPPHYRSSTPPLVIVLDLSRSMDATDLRPSRLAIARTVIHSLLERLPPRETGLLVFAGGAHRVMPLTEDRRLTQTLLQQLETGMMPVQGSNASAGLGLAYRLLQQAGSKQGDVLLVSDGVDELAGNRAATLATAGYRLLVLGIGTLQGGPIPDGEDAYLEVEGRPLLAPLDEAALRVVARRGEGIYLRWGDMTETLGRLLRDVAAPHMAVAKTVTDDAPGEVWRERGPWLLLFLLPIALLGFRRGLLGLLLLPLLLPLEPAEAGSWQELWWNQNQLARQRLKQGDHQAAADLFQDPLWRGTALYLAGDYAAAVDSLARSNQATAHYNRGNALLQLGRTRKAIDAYSEALRRDPDYAKAHFNLALARRLLASSGRKPPPLSIPRQPNGKRPPGKPAAKRPEHPGDQPRARPPAPPEQKSSRPRPDSGAVGGNGDRPAQADNKMGDGAGAAPGADKKGRGKPVERTMAREPERQSQPKPGRNGKPPGTTRPHRPPPPAASSRPAPRSSASASAPPLNADAKPAAAPPQRAERSPADTDPQQSKGPSPAAQDPQAQPRGSVANERQRAIEHWLQRIPDDSGGLLQELFRREHQRGQDLSRPGEPW